MSGGASFASGNVSEQCLDNWRRYCAEADKGPLVTVGSIRFAMM